MRPPKGRARAHFAGRLETVFVDASFVVVLWDELGNGLADIFERGEGPAVDGRHFHGP